MSVPSDVRISTMEMHSGGEPLRIVQTGYPQINGKTILDKRRYAREHLDHYRRFLMFEPRGHFDMYGALIVDADIESAHFAVLFIHNEGYSTMCGHAMMCLGRYALDQGIVPPADGPETEVRIQCPCGLVRLMVEYSAGKSGRVRFLSVPAFAVVTDRVVDVAGHGAVTLDVGYGGAFYALVDARRLGLDVRTSKTSDLVAAATAVSEATRAQVPLHHPDDPDLAFLYGTILTDGQDDAAQTPTANVCVFADREVDRSPCGSGVTARVAVQSAKGLISPGQTRVFESGVSGSQYTGGVHARATCGEYEAVVVEVAGKGQYSGTAVFTMEADDDVTPFLLR